MQMETGRNGSRLCENALSTSNRKRCAPSLTLKLESIDENADYPNRVFFGALTVFNKPCGQNLG